MVLTKRFNAQVVEVNMKVEEPGPENPHNNAFYAEETLLHSELQAQRDCNALSHRHWIVRSYLYNDGVRPGSALDRFSGCRLTSFYIVHCAGAKY